MSGPLTSEGLRVRSDLCSTCIFRPGNLMELHSGRVRQMVDDSLARDTAIVCHELLDAGDVRAVCRGFWDRHRRDTLLCRLGGAFGTVEVP